MPKTAKRPKPVPKMGVRAPRGTTHIQSKAATELRADMDVACNIDGILDSMATSPRDGDVAA